MAPKVARLVREACMVAVAKRRLFGIDEDERV
jgi:hypothetical protein